MNETGSELPIQMRQRKTGVLLLNLGTPDAPQRTATRRYLKQFLSDPRVLDISALGRYLLLRFIILPFRSGKSAKSYRQIWTSDGSPIKVYGRKLVAAVQENLDRTAPGNFDVRLGMRYANPSIQSVIESFQRDGIDRIMVMPLYPQYASASVGSTLEEVYRAAGALWNVPQIEVIPPFFDNPGFIESWRQVAGENIKLEEHDYFLFSFHGLPERQIKKSDLSGGKHCLMRPDCCETIGPANRYCYRAQCFYVAGAIARALGLPQERWQVTFQSRLGRDPWLRPFTDLVIKELPSQGVKRLAMFSPAFVADCLETLEELSIRAVDDFKSAGGEKCTVVPSLNINPQWVRTVAELILVKTNNTKTVGEEILRGK